MAPPELDADAISQILIRMPPDEPAHLIRASLVCKPWRRILFDPAFLRRYREFHRTPPLLGFLRFKNHHHRFDSTATASPFSRLELPRGSWQTLDCRHGRVLFFAFDDYGSLGLLLWNPITGEQQRLPKPKSLNLEALTFSAAVLCAVDSCNHFDCHGGPFLVVLAAGAVEDEFSWASEYSSETGVWSDSTTADFSTSNKIRANATISRPSLFTGDAAYFILPRGNAILKYDLGGRGLSVIDVPDVYNKTGIVMTAEDGGLGYAGVKGYNLYLWSWKANAEGIRSVKGLKKLLSIPDMHRISPDVIGFVEGTDTIFVSTCLNIFTLKLKSGQIRKVGPRLGYGPVVPYMSFYTQ
ncbi:hypothetical protein EJB05_14174, partial [Eragrostis curvula]